MARAEADERCAGDVVHFLILSADEREKVIERKKVRIFCLPVCISVRDVFFLNLY